MYPFILTLAYFANAQSSCPSITVYDLGSTTDFSTDGLVPKAVRSDGDIPVRIIAYHTVCDASVMALPQSPGSTSLAVFRLKMAEVIMSGMISSQAAIYLFRL